ncbi:unnamed protein product [Sphagnum jensenii]|uniref:Pentatricopeptide repeat-containing protein n=2 Tax=Sphagnum jensenii TaxID=128206 RepID=A0ABP1AFG0_9BRYO
MQPRAGGAGTISTNATGGCATKLCYFCGGAESCASVLALEEGRSVHQQISRSGCECDVFVGNSLVDMYAKCGSLEDAWGAFNKMASRNVVTWNAIVGGCAMDGHGKEALRHFEWMSEEGVEPDDITFVCLLSACGHAGGREHGHGSALDTKCGCMDGFAEHLQNSW